MTSERAAAHARRRAATCERALAAAGSPQEQMCIAFDWLRATQPSDRTASAVARALARMARRADARTGGRVAARLSDDTPDAARSLKMPALHAITRDHARERSGSPSDRQGKPSQTGRVAV